MFIIWHDNDFDLAYWVYKNSSLKGQKVLLRPIPKENSESQIRKTLPQITDLAILPIIKLEKPDIIIQRIDPDNKSKILFVSEFMTHTPQWQHPAQRFSRIYSSSLLRIPTALILNKDKVKFERKKNLYKEVKYSCSPSVFSLFIKTTMLTNSPALLFFWPNVGGFPITDLRHATAPFIDESIKSWFDFLNDAITYDGHLTLKNPIVNNQIQVMQKYSATPTLSDFTTIEGIIDTKDLIKELKESRLPPRILQRKKTLIFTPDGLSCAGTPFRTDPYAGMLCAFDNLFCRDDANCRKINLVLRAKNVSISMYKDFNSKHNYADCPFILGVNPLDKDHFADCPFTMAKYLRIYGEVADVVIFDDGVFISARGSLND